MRAKHNKCGHCGLMFNGKDFEKHTRKLYAKQLVNEVGICLYFVNKGTCKYGDECRYSHDVQAIEEGRKLNGACMRYFNKGSCSNGITCKQSHDT